MNAEKLAKSVTNQTYCDKLTAILQAVRDKKKSIKSAFNELKYLPFEPISEFAKIDHHRSLRGKFTEVVFCEGKTKNQAVSIIKKIIDKGEDLLATRATPDIYRAIKKYNPAVKYNIPGRIIYLSKKKRLLGQVAIISAGTADIPVAEEAYVTSTVLGSQTIRIYDVGVAGVHRLLAQKDKIESSNILVVLAGMEAALPSIVAGLFGKPVVAVPVSTGYGTAFKGVTALLGILNSCASGVVAVNIDNGFGAAYFASIVNQAIANKKL